MTEPPILGYMVHTGDPRNAALYNLNQHSDAEDAARRWGASIAAMTVYPGAPLPMTPSAPADQVLVPKRLTRAMRAVIDEEGWTWEDLLAAAEVITEAEHAELQAAPADQTRSQKMRAAGFTPRPTWRSLPEDGDDELEADQAPADQPPEPQGSSGSLSESSVEAGTQAPNLLLEWAVMSWREQVEHRPLVNVHRRTLDGVWRQVIRYAGGDAEALIGPRHDELLERQ